MAKLPYTRVKKGHRYFEPTPELRALGFEARALGEDGPAAWKKAADLYAKVLAARKERGKITDYPNGSLGSFYDHYRRTKGWARKSPRTREDYERAWKHLDPVFGRKILTAITVADVEDFREELKLSPSERYRTLKVLRSLLNEAILRLKLNIPNVARAVPNPQAPGRTQIWLGAEVAQLVQSAEKLGYHGMALGIRIGWDTLFSPVDVWGITHGQVKRDAGGIYIERERGKTAKQAYGALTSETAAALERYVDELPFEVTPDTPLLRQRNGNAYISKDTFGDDFRAVRNHAFPGDKRVFLDLRRSGNVEADIAGADKETMGEILANLIASNKFLDDTYTPATVAKAREVARQREAGRQLLVGELSIGRRAG